MPNSVIDDKKYLRTFFSVTKSFSFLVFFLISEMAQPQDVPTFKVCENKKKHNSFVVAQTVSSNTI